MFPKFQTPVHLKIDLDQVHFTELKIYIKKKNLCQQQKEKPSQNLGVLFNTMQLSHLNSPNKF